MATSPQIKFGRNYRHVVFVYDWFDIWMQNDDPFQAFLINLIVIETQSCMYVSDVSLTVWTINYHHMFPPQLFFLLQI